MREPVAVKAGDLAVIKGRYTTKVKKVERVTAQKAFFIEGARTRPCWISDIVFAGSEEAARLLCDRLTSSAAQCTEETRSANRRKIERDDKLIANAILSERSKTEAGK